MLRTQIYLPEDIILNLRNLAQIEDVSISELIRKTLRRSFTFKEKAADPMQFFVGKYKSRLKTNSPKEINRYYLQKNK